MNKIISILMCFQLILSPVAIAAEETLPGEAGLEGIADTSYDQNSGSGGYDLWATQIMILGTSVVGAHVFTQCKQAYGVPSLYGYMGANAFYILREWAAAEAEGDRHKKDLSSIDMIAENMPKTGGEMQKTAIQFSLENEKKLLEFLQNKKATLTAVTVMWTLSSIGSLIEAYPVWAYKFDALCTSGTTKHKQMNKIFILGIMGVYGLGVGTIDGGGAISQWGKLLLSGLTLVSDSATHAVSSTISAPIPRALTIGAHAALGTGVIIALDKRVNAAKKNIEKLENVLAEFKVTTEGEGGLDEANGGAGNGSDVEQVSKAEITRLGKGVVVKKTCLGKDGQIGSASCKDPARFTAPKFDFGSGLSTLQSTSALGENMVNAAAAGDFQKADIIAGQIASQAGRIKAIGDEVKKKFNDRLKAEGKKPIDFDKEIKARVADIQKVIDQAAAAQGVTRASFASIDSSSKEVKESGPKGLAVAPKVPGPATSLDLGLDEPETVVDEAKSASLKTGHGLDQFESTEADISKQSDVSIFLQLSNRYILNYTRIFKKEEPTPTPLVPADSAKK